MMTENPAAHPASTRQSNAFWSVPAEELMQGFSASFRGLPAEEAARRLEEIGPNRLTPRVRSDIPALVIRQFTNPLTVILLAATLLSFFLHDPTDATIIIVIILVGGLLGFWQEHRAADAVSRLLSTVQTTASVIRDGVSVEVPLDEVVPGDVLQVEAGSVIPADALVLEARDLSVDEAVLTGETYPVEKGPGLVPPDAPLASRTNVLHMGTHVVSGVGRALAALTGSATEFGKVSQRLKLRPPETEFERGIRQFGYFLMEVTVLLTLGIFAVNAHLGRPILESFLFSLALAVGLTPQLLPAIVSLNLAYGARRMAQLRVVVKHLPSIENFGSMDILCSDKTGTLTEGKAKVHSAVDAYGRPSARTLRYAYVNAVLQAGFTNPIDEAIRAVGPLDLAGTTKLDEVPYDFVRKRLSVLVSMNERRLIIIKGAVDNVLAVCSHVERADDTVDGIAEGREAVLRTFRELSAQGYRTLGVAYRAADAQDLLHRDDETAMTFLGLLVFFDPPKPAIAETVGRLRELGITLKVVTGDNRLVAATLARNVGFVEPRVLTGAEMRQMSDEALLARADRIDIFAEIEPNQKERIILALRKAGHVVGFMGDGINDASALHAADVGVSVNTAVDVAREAAGIVLLEQDLGVLVDGVREGRRTFANTLKYIFMATSANFGNMFSMAGASLFLSFFPLLPKQILLTNLMTDFPELAIASDTVDPELTVRPRRWSIAFVRRFMLIFGLLSSIFDYLTFGALLLVLHAAPDQFRTAWFVESIVSASLVMLMLRSRRHFSTSRPSRLLLAATSLVVAVAVILPFTPLAQPLGFVPLPARFLLFIALIVAVYVLAVEAVKVRFYRREVNRA